MYGRYAEAAYKENGAKAALEILKNAADHVVLPRELARFWERCYIEYTAEKLSALAEKNGWIRIGVAPFVVIDGYQDEGGRLAQELCRTLADNGFHSVTFREYPSRISNLLMGTLYEELSPEEQSLVEDGRDDVIVAGRICSEIVTCACDLKGKETEIVALTENPGIQRQSTVKWPVTEPGIGEKNPFVVEIQSEKSAYTVGEPLRLFVRATRSCYITIAAVQTSGKVSLILPILDRKKNFAQIGIRYTIPREGAGYKISGPGGVEKIKVIATRQPIYLDTVITKELEESIFLEVLLNRLNSLEPGSWAAGACGFTVK